MYKIRLLLGCNGKFWLGCVGINLRLICVVVCVIFVLSVLVML